MTKALIINGHQPYPFAKGQLNAAMQTRIASFLEAQAFEIRTTQVAESYDIDTEIEKHQWADVIVMQFPVNWMGVPWSFKQYMDAVYSAGMDGRLCDGDGRTAEAPKANYGTGGTLNDTKYMLSVTLNAPAEAFDDPTEPFFAGASLDDLLLPVHLNAKFFGMKPLPTFAAFDVMKNPDIERDFQRLGQHLTEVFSDQSKAA
ncbi:MAG: NAD(P)H-dependent oxidoreductase [Pseudomonadota bacterium]